MYKPRPCSYNKNHYDENYVFIGYYEWVNDQYYRPKKTMTIGEPIPRDKSLNGSADFTLMPVELRGITLRQLRAIKAKVETHIDSHVQEHQEGLNGVSLSCWWWLG